MDTGAYAGPQRNIFRRYLEKYLRQLPSNNCLAGCSRQPVRLFDRIWNSNFLLPHRLGKALLLRDYSQFI